MRYRTTGIHTRTEQGELKIYYPGSILEPTEFELKSFPDKFSPLVEGEDVEIHIPETETGGEDSVDTTALNEAREKLQALIDADEYEESVMVEAKKLASKNPQKQSTVDALVEKINEFLASLEDTEEEGGE